MVARLAHVVTAGSTNDFKWTARSVQRFSRRSTRPSTQPRCVADCAANCKHFQGKAGDRSGRCSLFGGKAGSGGVVQRLGQEGLSRRAIGGRQKNCFWFGSACETCRICGPSEITTVITRRRVLLANGVGLLIAHPLCQGVATIRRIGWLSIGSKDSPADLHAEFKQGMRDLGWQEGKNVEYQFLYADGSVDRLDAMAGELVRRAVDIIVVNNALTTRAAQKATKSVPIVMTGVSSPVSNGFVASLAKPGGNITGIAIVPEEVQGKLIEILHEIVPKARRIAIVVNDSNLNHAALWSAAQSACSALDLDALRFGSARRRSSAPPSITSCLASAGGRRCRRSRIPQ